jgi:hypothetical protein
MAKYLTVMAHFELLLIKHLLLNFGEIFNLAHLQSDILHYLLVVVRFLAIGKVLLA